MESSDYDEEPWSDRELLEYSKLQDLDVSQTIDFDAMNQATLWDNSYKEAGSFMHPRPLAPLEPQLLNSLQSPTSPKRAPMFPQHNHQVHQSYYPDPEAPSSWISSSSPKQNAFYEHALPSPSAAIRALQEENVRLKRQLEQSSRQFQPSSQQESVVSQSVASRPRSPAVSVSNDDRITLNARGKRNRRTQNMIEIRKRTQTRYHATLSPVWPNWQNSWTSAITGFVFSYTRHGELDTELKLTPDQMVDYIDQHQNHSLISGFDKKSDGLTLWIQNSPADSSARYPGKDSSKCRFTTCPVPANTISKGEYRVCFDEWAWKNDPKIDPFHNAGYAHLFCMEEQIDFPLACRVYNVRGDDRHFRAEPNKMAITRDYSDMLSIVDDYIAHAPQWGAQRPENWFDESLTKRLVEYHLEHQPGNRQAIREARGGNSLDKHMGNLRVRIENAAKLRAAKRKKAGKRKRDDSDLSDDLDVVIKTPPARDVRPVKRRKVRDPDVMGKRAQRQFNDLHYYTQENLAIQNDLFGQKRFLVSGDDT